MYSFTRAMFDGKTLRRFSGGAARGAMLAAVCALVYLPSLAVPFIFDDFHSIASNPAIRRLWPPWGWLGGTRPVVDLTLAVNYALGGLSPWGYHVFNLVLHCMVSVLVADVGRLVLEWVGGEWEGRGVWVGLWAGLIFAVHPVQSEAVTYVISRSELLVGFWYMMVVDLSIRGMVRGGGGVKWEWVMAVVCSVLGMGSKEVMVTVPVMVWWVGVSLGGGGMRGRGWLYGGLGSSWLVLGYLLVSREHVGVGGSVGIEWWEYLGTELGVVVHYLRLYVWPVGLTLDYDWPVARSWARVGVVVPGLVLVGLVVLGLWLVVRGKGEWGVWVGWVLGVLVPTSSVYPIADVVFEHRMYLAVSGLGMLTAMVVERFVWRRAGEWGRGAVVLLGAAVVVGLGLGTMARNRVWQDPVRLWRDTVAKAPLNARARNNLGRSLIDAGRWNEAIPELERAIALDRGNRSFRRALNITSSASNNLGVAYTRTGQYERARETFEKVIGETTDQVVLSSAMTNLGYLYWQQGRNERALSHWLKAIEVLPANGPAHGYVGTMYAKLGRWKDAIRYLERATTFVTGNTVILNNLGIAYANVGRYADAASSYRRALEIDPGYSLASDNLRRLPPEWR